MEKKKRKGRVKKKKEGAKTVIKAKSGSKYCGHDKAAAFKPAHCPIGS